MKPALFILAGGRSSRFGSDKARALHRGRPLIVAVADDLAGVTVGPTVVAAQAGAYEDLGLDTIADHRPALGPLGGLATALAALPDRHPGVDWLLLAACDLVAVAPNWVGLLTGRAAGAVAVAFRAPAGWEPVFALYHRDLGGVVADRLESDDTSLNGILDAVSAVAVPVPPGFMQVTAPGDLDALSEEG